MTHEPERVEDIISAILESHEACAYSPHMSDEDCKLEGQGCLGECAFHRGLPGKLDRLSAALSHERESKRLAVMKVAEDAESVRALYGELVPFDPTISGFDAVFETREQQMAVCRMLNAVLNGEWAAALRKAVE